MANDVFTLYHTETNTKKDKKWVGYDGVEDGAQRQMTTEIPIGFCVLVLGICLGLGITFWQCEWTIMVSSHCPTPRPIMRLMKWLSQWHH